MQTDHSATGATTSTTEDTLTAGMELINLREALPGFEQREERHLGALIGTILLIMGVGGLHIVITLFERGRERDVNGTMAGIMYGIGGLVLALAAYWVVRMVQGFSLEKRRFYEGVARAGGYGLVVGGLVSVGSTMYRDLSGDFVVNGREATWPILGLVIAAFGAELITWYNLRSQIDRVLKRTRELESEEIGTT